MQGGEGLFRLNFEKAAIFVLILILCISAANIFGQYISVYFSSSEPNRIHTDAPKNLSFPAMLLKADRLYDQGIQLNDPAMLEEAQKEYFKLANMPNLSNPQKAAVYFKLGLCNYRLGKYDLARDSFLKSAGFNNNDPVAYNNAAVCSFYLNEPDKAEELQKIAVASRPAVEYHYNLARIYEASGRFVDSVKYYTAVIRGEDNITMEDRIDPVRIKNKVMKLMTNIKNADEISKELAIALRLNESREVFIIEDEDMDIKNKNFQWRIQNVNGVNRLYCSYDREKSDPYNLIESLQWTVKSDEKTVYTGKKDSFLLSLVDGYDYIVYLDIKYNSNKSARSFVNVTESSGMYSGHGKTAANPSDEKCKYYEYAIYEQVFDKDFRIRRNGYIDRFNTEWGKDDTEVFIMDKDFIDTKSALYIKNTSGKAAGIWADLSSLIKDKNLQGKTIGIKFYARKITANAGLDVVIRTKAGEIYKNIPRNYGLEYKWKRYGVDVLIPENGDGLTISFKTPSGEEVKIDGFIITIVR